VIPAIKLRTVKGSRESGLENEIHDYVKLS